VYLASSDLTHYGPDYGLAPAGVGVAALDWANENDSRLMDVVTLLSPEAVVPHVREFFNACGGGAIAAMMAACRETGASRVNVLRMANSYEILRPYGYNRPDNAVGYSSVVIGE
jgi:AmmeMemoRadiSam system protein B